MRDRPTPRSPIRLLLLLLKTQRARAHTHRILILKGMLIMTLNEMAVRMLYKVQRVRIPIRELDYHRLDIRQ